MKYLLIALLAVVILGCGEEAGQVSQEEFAELRARVDRHDGEIEDLLAINQAQNETIEVLFAINESQTRAIGNLIEIVKRR